MIFSSARVVTTSDKLISFIIDTICQPYYFSLGSDLSWYIVKSVVSLFSKKKKSLLVSSKKKSDEIYFLFIHWFFSFSGQYFCFLVNNQNNHICLHTQHINHSMCVVNCPSLRILTMKIPQFVNNHTGGLDHSTILIFLLLAPWHSINIDCSLYY